MIERNGWVFYATLVMVVGCLAGRAETAYVGDQLVITVRAEPAGGAEALGYLSTGDAVEVLERTDGYIRVQTADGVVGWVMAQYLALEPAARQRLEAAEQQRRDAQAQAERLCLRAIAVQNGELDAGLECLPLQRVCRRPHSKGC